MLPLKFTNHLNMLKTCSACKKSIERKDCHENRYGEYICRSCQSDGVKVTRRQRFLNLKKKMQETEPKIWRLLIGTILAFSVLWLMFNTFESVGS